MSRIRFLLVALFSALLSPAFAQSSPAQIGGSGSWTALTVTINGNKVCYVQSVPRSIQPRNVNRDPIFFVVSDWPSRKTKAEPQVVPGYPYKEGSSVTAQIGGSKFAFFTRNDGNAGGAWVKERSNEQKLVDAMQRGSEMVVTGTSTRGTDTRDVYSLVGFTAALATAHKACNM